MKIRPCGPRARSDPSPIAGAGGNSAASLLRRWTERIEEGQAGKVFSLAVTSTHPLARPVAAMIMSSALRGVPFGLALGHQLGPHRGRPLLEGEAATPAGQAVRPGSRSQAAAPPRSCRPASPECRAGFRRASRRRRRALVFLLGQPIHQARRRLRFGDLAEDVGVEQVAGRRSTLRPASLGRERSSSAPTSGPAAEGREHPALGGRCRPPGPLRRPRGRLDAASSSARRFARASGPARGRRRARGLGSAPGHAG